MTKSKVILLFFLLFFFSWPFLFGQQTQFTSEEITIIAHYWEKKGDLISATGDVEVHYQNITLLADGAEVDVETKDVYAWGNVTIRSPEEVVSCEEIPQEGKPDRKVYEITEEGRQFLLQALENPNPCHKLRSEFLATMCFAHLMPQKDIETVIDNRLEEIKRYQEMFRDIEEGGTLDWPGGMKFVLGFGEALAAAMEQYITENRHLLAKEIVAKTATG